MNTVSNEEKTEKSNLGRIKLPEEGTAQESIAQLYDSLEFPEIILKNAIHTPKQIQKVHALPVLTRQPIIVPAAVSVIQSEPILRDLIKESTIFTPWSIRTKKNWMEIT